MYLCVCNALSDRKVRAALSEQPSPPRVSDAYRACGCTALCGACAAAMRDAVLAERARRGLNVTAAGAD